MYELSKHIIVFLEYQVFSTNFQLNLTQPQIIKTTSDLFLNILT